MTRPLVLRRISLDRKPFRASRRISRRPRAGVLKTGRFLLVQDGTRNGAVRMMIRLSLESDCRQSPHNDSNRGPGRGRRPHAGRMAGIMSCGLVTPGRRGVLREPPACDQERRVAGVCSSWLTTEPIRLREALRRRSSSVQLLGGRGRFSRFGRFERRDRVGQALVAADAVGLLLDRRFVKTPGLL